MIVKELMSREPQYISPDTTLGEAAQLMRERDCGFLLVGENERLIGTLTDRDMILRGAAEGMPLDTPVRDVMTKDLYWCFENDDLQLAVRNMMDHHIRRLAVLNENKKLSGILSVSDITMKAKNEEWFPELLYAINQGQ